LFPSHRFTSIAHGLLDILPPADFFPVTLETAAEGIMGYRAGLACRLLFPGRFVDGGQVCQGALSYVQKGTAGRAVRACEWKGQHNKLVEPRRDTGQAQSLHDEDSRAEQDAMHGGPLAFRRNGKIVNADEADTVVYEPFRRIFQ